MSWIVLTETDVASKLAAAELAAYRNVQAEADTLPATIASVTSEVRGYVSAYAGILLGPDGTIPEELRDAASMLTAYRLILRLPVRISTERQTSYDQALTLLRDCAAGRFRVVSADVPSDNQVQATTPAFTPRDRCFDGRGARDIGAL